jgi:hypothetical protein
MTSRVRSQRGGPHFKVLQLRPSAVWQREGNFSLKNGVDLPIENRLVQRANVWRDRCRCEEVLGIELADRYLLPQGPEAGQRTELL